MARAASEPLPAAGHPALIRRLLDRLRSEGIPHALLREGPPSDRTEELDLLVWPDGRRRFARVARELGFVRCRRRMPKKDVFAAYDAGALLLLDVHYAFVQGGLVYLGLPDPASAGREGAATLTAEEELLHLCFHSLLGKGGIQQKHLERVRELIVAVEDLERVRRRLGDDGLFEVIRGMLEDPDGHRQGEVAASAAAGRARALLLRAPGNRWRSVVFRVLPRLRRRRGLLVVFLGVDGAGKTTTIGEASRRLSALSAFPLSHAYMGPWGQFRTRLLSWVYAHGLTPPSEDWLRALGRRLTGRGGDGVLRCLAKWARGQVRCLAYYLAAWRDLWARYLGDVRPKLRRGGLVICDRYVHDLRYLFHSQPVAAAPLLRRLVCLLFPRPHLVVFLHNDPETIVARKAQLDVGEIRRLQETYRRALRGLPCVEIKTDRPVAEVADAVASRIVARYFEHR